jgi:Protein of unknown function (DUF2589)
MAITDAFAGLPLGLLVCSPIIEVAKGQAELCNVYLQYVMKLAYKDGDINKGEVNLLKFTLNRPVTDNQGNITQQAIEVNAPLLALVPVPAFTMQEATVSFNMEVKSTVVDKNANTGSASSSFGGSFWGFTASISGGVSSSASTERTTDQSAKYTITAKAIQQPPAEGMSRLNTIFAAVIEPIVVKK